jgi:crotonobetainyl-CoA:carnitine CoA-transferase CaiB-like acyl-CoA transferase
VTRRRRESKLGCGGDGLDHRGADDEGQHQLRQRHQHQHQETLAELGSPVASGATPPKRPAPALGADTDAVLRDCGFTPERIAALRRDGVI